MTMYLHWRKTRMRTLLNSYRHSYRLFCPTLVSVGCSSKCRTHLLCNLHRRLQIDQSLCMHPGLHWWLQTIDKLKHGFGWVNIRTLSIFLRKLHDVLSNWPTLTTLSKGLTCFIRVVRWFKVTKQCSLQRSPTGHISLDRMPSKLQSI